MNTQKIENKNSTLQNKNPDRVLSKSQFIKENEYQIIAESESEGLDFINNYLSINIPEAQYLTALPTNKQKILGKNNRNIEGSPIVFINWSYDYLNFWLIIDTKRASIENGRYSNKELKNRLYHNYLILHSSNPDYFSSSEYLTEQANQKKKQAKEKAKRDQTAKQAARKAEKATQYKQRLFNQSLEQYHNTLSHHFDLKQCPYLIKKGVADYATNSQAAYNSNDNILYQPIYNGLGKIAGIQKISPHKEINGKVGGNFGLVGCSLETAHTARDVLVAEGLATALAVHAATQKPVIIAFFAHNIGKALHTFFSYCRQQDPDYIEASVLVAADNDQWLSKNTLRGVKKSADIANNRKHPEHQKHINGGLSAAKKVINSSKFRDIRLCYPEFSETHHLQNPTDFNDLFCLSGLEAVRTQLATPILVTQGDYFDQYGYPPAYLSEIPPTNLSERLHTQSYLTKKYSLKPYVEGDLSTLFNNQALQLLDNHQVTIAPEDAQSFIHHYFSYEHNKPRSKDGYYDYNFPDVDMVEKWRNKLGHDCYEGVVQSIIATQNNQWRGRTLGYLDSIPYLKKETYNTQYIGNFSKFLELEKGITNYFLQCLTGSGKTQSIVSLLKTLPNETPFVAITPLVSLCKNTATAFDITNYKDVKGTINDINRIAITPNSLHRIKNLPTGEYIVFIDEIEQVLSGYNSTMYKNKYERTTALYALNELIKNAKYIIYADANLSEKTARYVLRQRGEHQQHSKFITEYDRLSKRHTQTMTVHTLSNIQNKKSRLGKMESKIRDHAKMAKNMIIGGNFSVNTINALKKLILNEWKECHIETSHAGNQGSAFNKAVAKDPNHATTCNVFIYTTVLCSGISINDKTPNEDGTPHFKHGFYYFWNLGGGSKTNAQLLARYRADIPADCFIDSRQFKEETDPYALLNNAMSYQESELSTALNNGDQLRAEKIRQTLVTLESSTPDITNEPLRQLIDSNTDRNNFVENTLGYLHAKYTDVSFDYSTAERLLPDYIKQEKEDKKTRVINSPDIELYQAKLLENKDDRTESQSEQLHKYQIADYFSTKDIQKEITYQGEVTDLYDIYNGDIKRRCDNVRKAMTPYKHQDEEITYLATAKATIKYTFHLMISAFYDIEKQRFKQRGISEQQAQELCSHIVQHDKALSYAGIIKWKNTPDSVIRILKHCFKNAFGVELIKETKQKSKIRYNTYKLSVESKQDLKTLLNLFEASQQDKLPPHLLYPSNDSFYTQLLEQYDNDSFILDKTG